MNLTLDAATEKRIQREISRGHLREPAEVIAHALALLEDHEDRLLQDRDAINQRLDESLAQIKRGEGIPDAQVRLILAQHRANQTA